MVPADGKRQRLKCVVLIPVFNDWKSLSLLLIELDDVLHHQGISVDVVIIDDASSECCEDTVFGSRRFVAIEKIQVLELSRNLGHQRAIAVGLAYLEANIPCGCVLIMDADGEDGPQDVPRLIEKCEEVGYRKIVFARRAKRNEGSLFQLFYSTYKGMYRLLTGHSIAVGNFSIIPSAVLRRLVSASDAAGHELFHLSQYLLARACVGANRNDLGNFDARSRGLPFGISGHVSGEPRCVKHIVLHQSLLVVPAHSAVQSALGSRAFC
jgi:hypothetical protein